MSQPDELGNFILVDLTGMTVEFKMINRADNSVAIEQTATGVTVTSAATGQVQYDFSASGVDTAGIYNAWFVVTDSGETDHFPVRQDGLRVLIDSDTQTAEQAFEAAIA
jgi:hypothetical protein